VLSRSKTIAALSGAAVLLLASVSTSAHAEGFNPFAPVTLYFTRHAEKQNTMDKVGDGLYMEVCGESKCAQELNPEGELRARLLAAWFQERGITAGLTHAFSSHKKRTLQTIVQIAADANLTGDIDLTADGALPGGSVAVVAGHSGTIYDIMEGLGLDTSNEIRFPRDAKGKVRDFGDIWKVVINPSTGLLV